MKANKSGQEQNTARQGEANKQEVVLKTEAGPPSARSALWVATRGEDLIQSEGCRGVNALVRSCVCVCMMEGRKANEWNTVRPIGRRVRMEMVSQRWFQNRLRLGLERYISAHALRSHSTTVFHLQHHLLPPPLPQRHLFLSSHSFSGPSMLVPARLRSRQQRRRKRRTMKRTRPHQPPKTHPSTLPFTPNTRITGSTIENGNGFPLTTPSLSNGSTVHGSMKYQKV